MKPDWPENAYAAQTIIARTFALKYLSDNKTNRISGSYQFAQEYRPEKITPEIREAVKKQEVRLLSIKMNISMPGFMPVPAGKLHQQK